MKLAVFLRVKYWNFHPEFYLGGFFCLASLTTVELGGLRDNLVVELRTAACLYNVFSIILLSSKE